MFLWSRLWEIQLWKFVISDPLSHVRLLSVDETTGKREVRRGVELDHVTTPTRQGG